MDDHFFRHESARMVAVLTKIFGVHNLALAEDVAQDAFCRALEVWKFRGMPENPSAWLMATAKNRALDVVRRDRTAREFAPELSRLLQSEWTLVPTVNELFTPHTIKDDELRMMFSCCHPRLAEESQIALVLHISCGFSVDEIAGAFVSTHSAIEKRITRAKKTFAGSKKLFDIADPKDFAARLPAVLRALYLLFSEGYHGASAESAVRIELCREAMRLVTLLVEHPLGGVPATYALAALMHLHVARLPSRMDAEGHLHSLVEQDRSGWDADQTREGDRLLELSATGPELSQYHIEAAIASVHASAGSMEGTNWPQIISLYDMLMRIQPSPVVALNRAIAVAQGEGPQRGLEELRSITDAKRLENYPFYFAALGEVELRLGQTDAAREHFREALEASRNPTERQFFERRIQTCGQNEILE